MFPGLSVKLEPRIQAALHTPAAKKASRTVDLPFEAKSEPASRSRKQVKEQVKAELNLLS